MLEFNVRSRISRTLGKTAQTVKTCPFNTCKMRIYGTRTIDEIEELATHVTYYKREHRFKPENYLVREFNVFIKIKQDSQISNICNTILNEINNNSNTNIKACIKRREIVTLIIVKIITLIIVRQITLTLTLIIIITLCRRIELFLTGLSSRSQKSERIQAQLTI